MNLNVELVDLGPCKKQLRFELPLEDVDAAFSEVTKQFQKQANLPGFRKGKAPLDKVQARFSQQIEDEVQKKLLNDSYRKGVEDGVDWSTEELIAVRMVAVDEAGEALEGGIAHERLGDTDEDI